MQKSNNQEQFPRPRVSQRINAKYLGNGGGYKSHPFPDAGKAMREMWLDRGPTTSMSRSHTDLTMAPGTHHSQTGNLLDVWSARHKGVMSSMEDFAKKPTPEAMGELGSEDVMAEVIDDGVNDTEVRMDSDDSSSFLKRVGSAALRLIREERSGIHL